AVLEDTRFRQTGGAGGVDVEAGIVHVNPVGGFRIVGGAVGGFGGQVFVVCRCDARVFGGVAVGNPVDHLRVHVEFAADFVEGIHQLFTDDGALGLHQVEAV